MNGDLFDELNRRVAVRSGGIVEPPS